jgi:thiamine-monophosphate kinase
MHEFDFIRQRLAPLARSFPGADSLGNDGATLPCPPGETLVVTTDTLVAGVHFFGWESPDLIARKALRVNLSDLAAMAARPLAYTLNLALPRAISADTDWLAAFCAGLAQDQDAFHFPLAGGDTVGTPGPLVVTVTAFGTVRGEPLRRSGAQPGQGIYVTGTLGDARAGLDLLRQNPAAEGPLVSRYLLPEPRVALALLLAPYLTAGLDVSDGLVGDLGHLCRASGVGARVNVDALPRSPAFAAGQLQDVQFQADWQVSGGDDYELLFTADPAHEAVLFAAARQCNLLLTRIGDTEETSGLCWVNRQGEGVTLHTSAFQHF